MKFGGTSVGDVAAFERVIHVVSTQMAAKPVIVVSAMTRVTDALLAAFQQARSGDADGGFESLAAHFERHVAVKKHFLGDERNGVDQELEYAREELKDLLVRVQRRSLPLPMLKDAIVSYGEQLSSRLLAEVLKSRGINARQVDSRRLNKAPFLRNGAFA